MSTYEPTDPTDPTARALAALRADVEGVQVELGRRFDLVDRQFGYLDRRFTDGNHRLRGAELRVVATLDEVRDHVDTAVRQSTRVHVTALVGAQVTQLVAVALLVVT